MQYCSVEFLQVHPEFEYDYLNRTDGVDWKAYLKRHGIVQSIRGNNHPKFFVSVKVWGDDSLFKKYLTSTDREFFNNKYIQFFGDQYLYSILEFKKLKPDLTPDGNYCTFVRYLIKEDTREEYIEWFGDFIDGEFLEKAGVQQILLLQNPHNQYQFGNLTIWNSRDAANNWKLPNDLQRRAQRVLRHEREQVGFNVGSILEAK